MHRKQLIKKFLRNECSAEEAELVMRYLEEEPSLLDEMAGQQEWDKVPEHRLINPDVDDAMRRTVKAATSVTPVRRIMAIAVAACLTGIILLGYFMRSENHENRPLAVAAIKLEELANTTSAIQKYLLPDGSVVNLYPGAVINFEKELRSNRHIYLKGKAGFDVMKNKQKPFVVYASDITTTALGTCFTVSELDNNTVEVQLFEGKVAVKSVSPDIKMDDVYLTPGNQCRINLQTSVVSVTLIPVLKSTQPSLPITPNLKKEITVAEKAVATMDFVKAPVSEVFSQLEQIYGVRIDYNDTGIEGAYFTGLFKPGSSINTVLDIVCAMNGLSWQRINDTIRIEKSKTGETVEVEAKRQSTSSALTGITTNNNNILLPQVWDIEVTAMAPERIKPATYYVQQDGTILFNKTRLADALEILQKIKSSKIYFFENEIEHVYITGSVDHNSSLEQALTAICAMNGLRLDIENEQFIIRRN